ncbi:tetratricopeptide repeat protein [Phenylobacterium sp.]|jgi:Flp pilus assembly protein TadD|uniref:tetratricopeptide repeat protein n=1 Tax=Phenylobacterium sp. TaxID=1871053 RepID=UPI002E34E8C9|nr:tetratricopeptide repeat protein [Phenylobacterium sp.]HEX3366031.1 tetratricopeptide repeat protein [Phenylobacterium sp.]
MRRILNAAVIGGGLALLAGGGVALASGGGSSGGSSGPPPSVSAPRYDPSAEYAKAVAALKGNQFKAAASAAEHVTEVIPKNPDAWRLLGAARAGDRDWRASRKAYERATKLTPDDAEAHAGLGIALANLKDSKAKAEMEWLAARASACGESCPDAGRLKSFTAAVEDAMSAAASGPPKPSARLDGSMLFGGPRKGDAAYVQAVSLINEKRYDEALASLSVAAATFGPLPDILTYQGFSWRKKGDYDRAETFYRQALAIDPKHIGALEYYGELKVVRGDVAGAKLMLARLDRLCAYGCADAEELRRWIDIGHDPDKG